jgi:hypothetical protein
MDGSLPQEPQGPNPRRRALIGLLVIVLLVIGGLMLAHILRDVGRLQDCVMSGRTNCAPVETSTPGASR